MRSRRKALLKMRRERSRERIYPRAVWLFRDPSLAVAFRSKAEIKDLIDSLQQRGLLVKKVLWAGQDEIIIRRALRNMPDTLIPLIFYAKDKKEYALVALVVDRDPVDIIREVFKLIREAKLGRRDIPEAIEHSLELLWNPHTYTFIRKGFSFPELVLSLYVPKLAVSLKVSKFKQLVKPERIFAVKSGVDAYTIAVQFRAGDNNLRYAFFLYRNALSNAGELNKSFESINKLIEQANSLNFSRKGANQKIEETFRRIHLNVIRDSKSIARLKTDAIMRFFGNDYYDKTHLPYGLIILRNSKVSYYPYERIEDEHQLLKLDKLEVGEALTKDTHIITTYAPTLFGAVLKESLPETLTLKLYSDQNFEAIIFDAGDKIFGEINAKLGGNKNIIPTEKDRILILRLLDKIFKVNPRSSVENLNDEILTKISGTVAQDNFKIKMDFASAERTWNIYIVGKKEALADLANDMGLIIKTKKDFSVNFDYPPKIHRAILIEENTAFLGNVGEALVIAKPIEDKNAKIRIPKVEEENLIFELRDIKNIDKVSFDDKCIIITTKQLKNARICRLRPFEKKQMEDIQRAFSFAKQIGAESLALYNEDTLKIKKPSYEIIITPKQTRIK